MTNATARNGCYKPWILLLRLITLALAITSAVVMATASECTIHGRHGAKTTVTYKNYQPFVYLVWSNVAVAILEVAAIYLHVRNDEDAPMSDFRVAVDVAVQMLLYSATGAVFAAAVAYGPQISVCASGTGYFSRQLVHMSKIISLLASLSAPCRHRSVPPSC